MSLARLPTDVLDHILNDVPVRHWMHVSRTCRSLRDVLSHKARWQRVDGWRARVEWIEYDPIPRLCTATCVVETADASSLYRCFVVTPWTEFDSQVYFRCNPMVRWCAYTRAVCIHRERIMCLVDGERL